MKSTKLKLFLLFILCSTYQVSFSQDINQIKYQTFILLEGYAKDIICGKDELKNSIDKILVDNIENDGDNFIVYANVPIWCYAFIRDIPPSKHSTGGREMGTPYKKTMQIKIIGKTVNGNTVINKLLLKTTDTYNQVYPSFSF